MSRYQNVRKRNDDKPRGHGELVGVLATAERLYLETGGRALDTQIEALELTAEAYRAQMQGLKSLWERGIQPGELDRTGWGPIISPYEARMSASNLAKLIKLREQKMKECRAVIEEGEEAARLAKEAEEAQAGQPQETHGETYESEYVEEAADAEQPQPAAPPRT